MFYVEEPASMEDMHKHELPAAGHEDHDVSNHAVAFDPQFEVIDGMRRCSDMNTRFCVGSKFISENRRMKKKPAVGLSDSSNIFTWFAAIFINLVVFQVRFTFRLLDSLIQVCYPSIFVSNISYYFSRSNVKEFETNTKFRSEILSVNLRIPSVKPTIARVVKKMAFGFIAAFHAVIVLSFLFITAFTLSSVAVKTAAYEPMNLSRELYFDYTQSPPVASIKFPDSKMYSTVENILRKLSFPTRTFHATVSLTLPESEFNKKLGIFQVSAELVSLKGHVLMYKSQPCMLHYRSTILQHTRSMIMAIPLLMGLRSETQTLALRLLEWQEETRFPTASVRIVLAPRAGRNLAKGLPEIYKAEIHLFSDTPWWLSIMGWKWTLCVWLGLVVFITEVTAILILCRWLLLPDLASLPAKCFKVLQQKGS